ncbi:unnamed protein product, partial [Ixodes persulcatus]
GSFFLRQATLRLLEERWCGYRAARCPDPRTPPERQPASLRPQTGRRPGWSPRRPGRQRRCPWRQPWSLVRRAGGAASGSARPRGRPEPSSCDALAGKTPSIPSAGGLLYYGLALSAEITLNKSS